MPSRGFFDTNLFRRSHGCLVSKAAATAAAKQLTKIASHFFMIMQWKEGTKCLPDEAQ